MTIESKSIRVQVDKETYKALKEEQERLEDETGEKRALSSILLDYAKEAIFNLDEEEESEDEESDDDDEYLPDDIETQRERVIYIIEDKGLSLEDFARSLNMEPSYIETILNDEEYDNLPIGLLLKVLQVYGEEYGNSWIKSNE